MAEAPYTKIVPGEVKYSEEKQVYGTLYPSINYNHGGLTPIMMSIRKALGSWYPFAQRQVSGNDRIGYAPREGDSLPVEEQYPNSVTFSNHYPSFYNPYKDTRAKENTILTRTYPTDGMQMKLRKIHPPRGCARQLSFFTRCVNIHGGDKSKCENEALNILNICPTFALEDLKQGRLIREKSLAIDERSYRESMKVSDYNKGRTVSNVSSKTWRDGERDKLRPDTMYADDRYADVTQSDIDAAKARIEKKKAQGKINTIPQAINPNPPYDWEHAKTKDIKNIYD